MLIPTSEEFDALTRRFLASPAIARRVSGSSIHPCGHRYKQRRILQTFSNLSVRRDLPRSSPVVRLTDQHRVRRCHDERSPAFAPLKALRLGMILARYHNACCQSSCEISSFGFRQQSEDEVQQRHQPCNGRYFLSSQQRLRLTLLLSSAQTITSNHTLTINKHKMPLAVNSP